LKRSPVAENLKKMLSLLLLQLIKFD